MGKKTDDRDDEEQTTERQYKSDLDKLAAETKGPEADREFSANQTDREGRTDYGQPNEEVARLQGAQEPTQDEWKEIEKTYDSALYKQGMIAAQNGEPIESNPIDPAFKPQFDSWVAGYNRNQAAPPE